jgi:hypothetical protein
MSFYQFTPADGSEPFGSFETFRYAEDNFMSDEPLKVEWYWHACFPGCIPDSDAIGPFQTEAEAIADANS